MTTNKPSPKTASDASQQCKNENPYRSQHGAAPIVRVSVGWQPSLALGRLCGRADLLVAHSESLVRLVIYPLIFS